ncbi:MAG: transmembrane prediction [Gammaproteobacteria bacterium]|nr:transmembrane prediction [Gammaproteobacteria bacterium]|tara:strand:- start:150 stop:974 length:825 start_codon:yes stop_codon:yes gene_type:complete
MKAALLSIVSLIASFELSAQVTPLSGSNEDLSIYGTDITEFTWLRGQYTNHNGGAGGYGWRRRGGWWDTDYPDSDENFLRGVQRYTNVDTNPRNRTFIQLTDPRLFEHIFLYMNWKRVPIGSSLSGPNFSEEEIASLREFMYRGGFVMVDDFWGEPHLDDMFMEIGKIFPDREIMKLDTTHEIFHTFFDIDEVAQVPGRMVTWDFGGFMNLDDPSYPPEVYAILDDDGRVMMVANYNTDLGDGWEHTFYEGYPTQFTNEAYKIGINFLIYAFSH